MTALIADQIEVQTKPPRIPEPGPWGVVSAKWDGTENGDRHAPIKGNFVRVGRWWRSLEDGFRVGWLELIDPVLVREGLS